MALSLSADSPPFYFLHLSLECTSLFPVHQSQNTACGIRYYRAAFVADQKSIKLGTFKTPEEAFQKYKEYKEQYIKDTAKRYKDKIPYSVYEAMMNWKIEITD